MIPIVFGYDQIKAKRMAFNKPVVMATDLGSQVLIQLKIPRNFLLIVLNMCQIFRTLDRHKKAKETIENSKITESDFV